MITITNLMMAKYIQVHIELNYLSVFLFDVFTSVSSKIMVSVNFFDLMLKKSLNCNDSHCVSELPFFELFFVYRIY